MNNTDPKTTLFYAAAGTEHIDVLHRCAFRCDWYYAMGFSCGDQKYVDCTPVSHAHLSTGSTTSPEGGRISLNIEYVGGALTCEHCHERIGEKHHCRLESISDTIFGNVLTTTHVWELIATQLDGDRHRFTANVLPIP